MPEADFRRIVHELRRAGVDQLGLFYMSEPFVHEGLAEAIRWTKQVGGVPYVFLTTNGLAADEHAVKSCMEAGLDSLKFAINFADVAQLCLAGGPGVSMDCLIDNVRSARRVRDELKLATGHECKITASSLEVGPSQHERMAGLLSAIAAFVDEHYWLPFYGRSEWLSAEGQDTSHAGIVRKSLPCWTLFAEAHVRADGHLSACCLDASDRFVVDDLNVTEFVAAWHSPKFQALRSAHLSGDLRGTACEQCIGYG